MKSTLIDAGPLIALFDRDDRYHEEVIQFFKTFEGRLITTWPVITEVSYMLNFSRESQIDFLGWVQAGATELMNLKNHHLGRTQQIIETYADLPADLADATLLVTAEEKNIWDIITLDSDFLVLKTSDDRLLTNLLQI